MRRRFREWVEALDDADREVGTGSPTPWVHATVVAFGLMILAAFAPGSREFFDLRFGPASLAFLPALSFGLLSGWLDRRVGLTKTQYAFLVLATSASLQFYTFSLISFSQLPGAVVMASLPIMAATYHGHLYRVTLSHPFGAFGTLLASTCALALASDHAHTAIFSVAAPAALGGTFLLGTISWRTQREREQQRALREAVQAQILDESTRDVTRLSDAILKILQTNHDASNALTAALLGAQAVLDQARGEPAGDPDRAEIESMAVELLRDLTRLESLVKETGQLGHTQGETELPVSAVDVIDAVRGVVRQVNLRHPDVQLAYPPANAARTPVRAQVRGGDSTLRRVLGNLVLNACEGDGSNRARRVEIAVHNALSVGAVVVQVIDDGPGFRPNQLEGPIAGFHTTKPEGTGLGLYTAERLVRASGGSLRRENGKEGGAVVSVYLSGVEP